VAPAETNGTADAEPGTASKKTRKAKAATGEVAS
jgi:hypothetical protein